MVFVFQPKLKPPLGHIRDAKALDAMPQQLGQQPVVIISIPLRSEYGIPIMGNIHVQMGSPGLIGQLHKGNDIGQIEEFQHLIQSSEVKLLGLLIQIL